MNITKISIERPSLIIVLYCVLILAGIIGFNNLSYELMPDFNQPVVVIKTIYPCAEPSEVENSVSRVLEDALSNMEGVDYISTKSMNNASVVIVNLNYGVDVDLAIQNAQRYINNVLSDLPESVLNPEISNVSPNDLPLVQVTAVSDQINTQFYQRLIDDFLPQIQQLNGVAEISIIGGERREIQVRVDQNNLAQQGISLISVMEAIKRAGINVPAGDIQNQNSRNPVLYAAKFINIKQILDVQIDMPEVGEPIYVRDVAEVIDGIQDIESINRYNGEEGIGLLIKKRGDANAVDVSRRIREKLAEIEQLNQSDNIRFIIADDTSENTLAAVNSVVVDLILAVILVSAVMLLFLCSYRNSLIVLVAIPTSLITAFAVMWLLGYTLNLMTLLAMSLIIGILVDDATVVLENIQRHLDMGKKPRLAAMEGRMEIGFSAISITLVDVVVFLPVLFLQVFVADMLKEFSVVVVTSTLTSLLVGFTLTPWMASRLGKSEELEPTNPFNRFLLRFEQELEQFTEWYGRTLTWVLQHKTLSIGVILFLFVATAGMMRMNIIGQELIATGDQGKFRLYLEYDKSTSLKENNLITRSIENRILAHPYVKSLFSNVGGPSTGMGSLGIGVKHKSELTIQLIDKNDRENRATEHVMIEMRNALKGDYPGVKMSLMALGLVPRSSPIEMTLSGSDVDLIANESKRVKKLIEAVPGADNVSLSSEEGGLEYKLYPNSTRMQLYGLNSAWSANYLRTAITGDDKVTLTESGTEFPVRIRLDEVYRNSVKQLQTMRIINPKGIAVPVVDVMNIEMAKSNAVLERRDRQPAVTITSETLGRPSGTVATDVVEKLKEFPLADGISMHWGSDIKRQDDSFSALANVMIISFILVYLIMVALYDSYIYPFVVLFSIPVAAIGAFLALNLSMSHLSLFALLGLIMLMGLVSKNAILIVDFTNQLKQEGVHFRKALIQAGKTRMRPILMTTISMVFGMLPIALATGTASEWKNGLAWVIIGGLLSSLMLTVYLVPIVFYAVDNLKEKFTAK